MSRTFKDRPAKIRFPEEKTKKKRTVLSEWQWIKSTPSWWNNLYNNRPRRRESRLWERNTVKLSDTDYLEDVDNPNISKKPHLYYY